MNNLQFKLIIKCLEFNKNRRVDKNLLSLNFSASSTSSCKDAPDTTSITRTFPLFALTMEQITVIT